MSEVAVILDTSALLAYADGNLAVGELIAEIADERRRFGIPAACLAQARAAIADTFAVAQIMLLTTTPTSTVISLGNDQLGRANPVWLVGEFALAAKGDIGIGQAVHAALDFEAFVATTEPGRFAGLLPDGWGVLNLRG